MASPTRRVALLEERMSAVSEADARRALLEHIGAERFEPRAWTLDQLEAAVAWHRERDPEGMARIEAMSDDELDEALADAEGA